MRREATVSAGFDLALTARTITRVDDHDIGAISNSLLLAVLLL